MFFISHSQSNLNTLTSLDDNGLQENTHSAAAYALSSYQGGGSGGSGMSNNGTHQMVVTHGKRVKSSLHRLEKQQDEFFQL